MSFSFCALKNKKSISIRSLSLSSRAATRLSLVEVLDFRLAQALLKSNKANSPPKNGTLIQ
jgi:hypothetical protein